MAKKENSTYGRTITIKYFANTKVKPRTEIYGEVVNGKEFWGSPVDKYPLYILVNVKQQNTKFKSMLNLEVAPDQLDEDLLNHSFSVSYEKKLIERVILAAKPFEKSVFNIHDVFKDYKALAKDFSQIIEEHLRSCLQEVLRESLENELSDDDFIMPNVERDLKALGDNGKTVGFNERFNFEVKNWQDPFSDKSKYPLGVWINYLRRFIPVVEKLYNDFSPRIWHIDAYCRIIKSYKNWDFISIDDWNSGRFDTAFMEYFKNPEELRLLKEGVMKLKSYKPDLKRLLSFMD